MVTRRRLAPPDSTAGMATDDAIGAKPSADDDPLFVASLEKGVRVLEAFRDATESLGLTDIATLTGVGKSAAQRFVHTWERMGYLVKDPATRRYRLGPRIVELSYFFLRSDRLISMAAPHLVALRDRCGLAVHLGVLTGGDMIYLLRLPSRQLTLAEMLPGRRMPAWCNSGGRMLLTTLDDAGVQAALRQSPPRPFTPRTEVSPDALLEIVRQARDDGYALTEDQVLQNQVGAAVLLRDARNVPLAAISVSAPRHDYPVARLLQDIVPQLFRTAQAIQHG